MEKTYDYDVLAVGGGPGATPGIQYIARHGLRTAIVEQGDGLGGTCLFEGCIPSKILLETAGRMDSIHHAAAFGITGATYEGVDIAQLMLRKKGILQQRAKGAAHACQQLGIDILKGTAEFIGPHEVLVRSADGTEKQVTARSIFIATGSESFVPPIDGAQLPGVWSSSDVLSLDALPNSITIVGGGYIGCELATLLNRFGVKVTVLEAFPQVLMTEDPRAALQVRTTLEAAGVQVMTGAKVTEVRFNGDVALHGEAQWAVTYDAGQGPLTIVSDKVLIAVGRKARTTGIRIERTGVQLGTRGEVIVNEVFQTSVPHIYAPGDVNGVMMLAHAATRQALLAAQHLLGERLTADPLVVPHVIFTDPEIASVGVDSRTLKDHPEWAMTTWMYRQDARALIVGDDQGFAQVVWDKRTHEIKGMQIVGTHAGELIQEGVYVISHQGTLDAIGETIHSHPVLSEVISELIAEALRQAQKA